jgi:signal transduction histidine kinase
VTAVADAARPAGVVRFTLSAVALAYGLATAAVTARFAAGAPTSYAASAPVALIVDLAAGLGLVAAGIVAGLARPSGSIGPVTTLLGIAWLAPDWIGWEGGLALARSLAMVAAVFVVPLLAHLALAFPTGRVTGRLPRLGLGITYGAAVVVALGLATVRDPFLDLYCWSNCTDNVFLVEANVGAARFLDGFWLRFAVVTGLVLAAICLWRLLGATYAARAGMWYVLVPAVLAALTQAGYAALRLVEPAEDPRNPAFAAVFVARAAALLLVAAGVTWFVVRSVRTRHSVARLASDLGEAPAPGSLRTALARSLGDDGLDVAYWLPGSHRYVDASGAQTKPRPGAGQIATKIERDGHPVALVIHDRSLASEHALEREIGAAARLAVDNERLRAEQLAQLRHLRSSRVRIVDTADTTRIRLERDLHDGAQQRLLALSYQVRLATSSAATEGDTAAVPVLAAAAEEAQCALTDLRELAHGIFPAILTEAGLGPALQTLADRSAMPLEIIEVPDERFPAATETAAYLVVRDAADEGATRSASHAVARIRRDHNRLVVDVGHDGHGMPADGLVHVGDRVGALGGRLGVNGNHVRAEIPCA